MANKEKDYKSMSSEEVMNDKENRQNSKQRNNRRSNRNKGSRSNYKGNKSNDISWHAKSTQLLNDCAAVPWSYSTGREVIRSHVGNHASLGDGTMYVPGIFALKTVLTPGVSTAPSDAINIAAQALYTDIRSQLKSANAYDASDVMIYMCEMAEIKAIIAFIRRILGTPLNYSFMNSYLPDDLIRAQGINPSSLHGDYAKYRSRANQCIAKASQIWWPKGFDYVTRAEWEYGNYYTEGESIKDQIYMFTPGLFRKFTYDESRDYAGKLEPCIKFTFGNLKTIDQVIDALSDMIDSVVGDSDFQNIAGDLFNRYGAGGVETFSLIPDSYIINPSLSYEVLEQMQNAKCLSFIKDAFDGFYVGSDIKAFDISQDETRNMLLVSNTYSWTIASASSIQNYKLDFYDHVFSVDKDPSNDKTMLITRCANVITAATINEEDTSTTFNLTFDVAMEFVVGFEFYYRSATSDSLQMFSAATSIVGSNTVALSIMSPFHYHPILQLGYNAGSKVMPLSILFGAIDTFTVISPEQIKDMNRVDLMSLFAVPNVGSVNK